MAKSIRSKWKRKCRAVKRERYAEKELARLKKTLGIENDDAHDVDMTDISKIATVVDAKKVKEDITKQSEEMEVEASNQKMQEKYGSHPVWMNKRKIAKHKKGRAKSQKAKKKTPKRLTRRQKKSKQNQSKVNK